MSKSEFLLIKNSVSKKIASHFSDHPKFVIGVSGGADSMALLFVMKELDIDCLVVHVNYGLRGKDSDQDQELVEGIAFEWGFECCSVRINSDESDGKNFQNWARKERYRIFSEISNEIGADGIVVAHHKDDQIETIIQKLFRGSAPGSWSGMSEWDDRLFRPLLDFKKTDIIACCNDKMIPFRIDKSNLSSEYSRNFIRNEFTEQLDVFFPGWQENILMLQEFGLLNEKMMKLLSPSYFEENTLNIEKILKVDKMLAQSIIKRFIEQFAPKITKGIIEEAYSLLTSQTGSELKISSSLRLVKERKNILLKENIPKFKDFNITKEILNEGLLKEDLKFYTSKSKDEEFYLDLQKLKFPLKLRTWQPGDRIQPLGMEGTQKVSDHLTNRKVSSITKEKSLVLSDTDGTIYAIIYGGSDNGVGTISEVCKATVSTKKYLLITTKKQA